MGAAGNGAILGDITRSEMKRNLAEGQRIPVKNKEHEIFCDAIAGGCAKWKKR